MLLVLISSSTVEGDKSCFSVLRSVLHMLVRFLHHTLCAVIVNTIMAEMAVCFEEISVFFVAAHALAELSPAVACHPFLLCQCLFRKGAQQARLMYTSMAAMSSTQERKGCTTHLMIGVEQHTDHNW